MKTAYRAAFSGGVDTVFYAVNSSRFLTYSQDREELHARYGGHAYYTSCSGLSGAGVLEPPPWEDDLIEWGTYRPGVTHEDPRLCLVGQSDGCPIRGAVPIWGHSGLLQQKPVVLTDGQHVAFFSAADDWPDLLRRWVTIEWRPMKIEWWAASYVVPRSLRPQGHGDLAHHEFSWGFYNPNHLGGVDASLFLDLEEVREATRVLWGETEYTPYLGRLLYIQRHPRHPEWGWLWKSPRGLIEGRYATDPRVVSDERQTLIDTCPDLWPGGWVGIGQGRFYRREGVEIHAFQDNEDTGVEFHVPVVEWFRAGGGTAAWDLLKPERTEE